MKRLITYINEEFSAAPLGAPYLANHRTPVSNIVQMLKAFTARMGVTVEPWQSDGVIIRSTKFNTKKGLDDVVCRSYFDNRAVTPQSIATYVRQCGLEPYVVVRSASQTDLVCVPTDTGRKSAPGIPLFVFLSR